ncbi:MAG: FAD-dependent oxidoreductase, partial [Planctomycetes bacterium]|nr:FAD-dependent oxidoreductase [Planctomycetota bacterium]
MTAALNLLKLGLKVDLYESSARLGGKAGAEQQGSQYEEHGYHIFPAWYLNTYSLLEEIGSQHSLIDITRFHQLRQGEYPRFKTLENFTSLKNAFSNANSGVSSWIEMMLFYYSVLDLISQSFDRREFLDQISVNGFVRSRFYRTEQISLQYQDLLLKFLSVPSYAVSAMTTKKPMSY